MCQRNAQMTVVISTTSRTLALDFAGAPYLSTQSNAQTHRVVGTAPQR